MTNKLKKAITIGTAIATVLAVTPASVLALTLVPTNEFRTLADERFTVQGVVSFIINGILVLAALFSFIFLLWGGVQWILAGGDKEGTEKARKRITAALVGLAIVFSAYAIAFLVETVFGVSIIDFTLPSINGVVIGE